MCSFCYWLFVTKVFSDITKTSDQTLIIQGINLFLALFKYRKMNYLQKSFVTNNYWLYDIEYRGKSLQRKKKTLSVPIQMNAIPVKPLHQHLETAKMSLSVSVRFSDIRGVYFVIPDLLRSFVFKSRPYSAKFWILRFLFLHWSTQKWLLKDFRLKRFLDCQLVILEASFTDC